MNKDVKIDRLFTLLDEAMDIAAIALCRLEEDYEELDPETLLNLNNKFETLGEKYDEELVND
jgi:hypothetical protein